MNQTPEAFRNACSQFIYVENLLPELKASNIKQVDGSKSNTSSSCNEAVKDNKKSLSISTKSDSAQPAELPIEIIRKVFESLDEEWITAAALGSQWKLLQVDFDPRSYGCRKLTDLIKKHPDEFEYEMRSNADAAQEHMYVKLKI